MKTTDEMLAELEAKASAVVRTHDEMIRVGQTNPDAAQAEPVVGAWINASNAFVGLEPAAKVLALIADLRELRARDPWDIENAALNAKVAKAETENRNLCEAIKDAGFAVMQTSGKWSIHPVTEKANQAEEVEGRLIAENIELERRVKELEDERSAVVDSLHRHGWPWSPDNMPLPEFVGGLCEAIQSYAVAQEKLRVREHNLEQALKPFAAYLDWRGSAMPDGVNTWPLAGSADGATGCRPVVSGWETRPPCMSWVKIRPPLACTAAVTGRHDASCASVCSPGVPGLDWPWREGWVPSVTMRPAVARWA